MQCSIVYMSVFAGIVAFLPKLGVNYFNKQVSLVDVTTRSRLHLLLPINELVKRNYNQPFNRRPLFNSFRVKKNEGIYAVIVFISLMNKKNNQFENLHYFTCLRTIGIEQ